MISAQQLMEVKSRLNELTARAKSRMQQCSPDLSGAMGGAEIDFMTAEEKAERHSLLLSLPSTAEEIASAKGRIRMRIEARRRNK